MIIFDLDGTLVDTRDGIAATFRATLAAAGLRPPPTEEVYPMIGLPLDAMFGRYVPAPPPAELVGVLVAEYRRRYRVAVTPRTRPFPEVAATLDRFRRAGICLAIATGKAAGIAREAVAAAGLDGLFAVILGADSVDRPKPAPDLVLRILAEVGADGSRALLVGDSLLDVAMGRAAGIRTCAVTYGVQTRAELQRGEPDYLVDGFDELPRIVGVLGAAAPGDGELLDGGAETGRD